MSDDELRRVCKLASALSFIEALPDGFDTEVGERGQLLSGGQRTRILIARALLRNPKVLLLDEPTSSVDESSEKEILSSLLRLSCDLSVLVCSHSALVMQSSNRLFSLEEGRLDLVRE